MSKDASMVFIAGKKAGFSCANSLFRSHWGAANPEKGVNQFAADLLMPLTIFGRYAYSKGDNVASRARSGATVRYQFGRHRDSFGAARFLSGDGGLS
jgi:hypothetical protein